MKARKIRVFAVIVPAALLMIATFEGIGRPTGVDSGSTPVWAKRLENSYGGVRVCWGVPDSAGGCLAVGDSGYVSNLDGWAIHLDKSGAVLKQMTYGGKKQDRLNSICASLDTGYIAAGWAQFEGVSSFENGGYGWLVKLGTELNPVWAKTFSASKTMNRFTQIIRLAKGQGYLATLVFEENGRWLDAIVRLNSSGGIVWADKLGDSQTYVSISEAVPSSDGGFFLVGSAGLFNDEDGVVIKIDGNGHFKWAKTYGWAPPVDDEFVSAYLTGAGDLMVFGFSYYQRSGLVLKLSSRGTVKWQYAYKDSLSFAGGLGCGVPGEGGGFYNLGSFCYNGVRILFAKNSAAGGILSQKSFLAFGGGAPNYNEYLVRAFRSSDGGIFILNSAVMPQDVVVAKLDAGGNLPKNCQSLTWNLARSKPGFKPADSSIPYQPVKVTVKAAAISGKTGPATAREACEK
jgi:hypothetical protein